MLREFIGDLGKYLPSYILPGIVGLIAIPIITRLFPPRDYGDYALVMAGITLLTGIAAAWIAASVIRFFSVCQLDNQLEKFYSTTIKLALLSVGFISLISLGVLLIAQNHISSNLYSLMCIGLLVFMATSFYNIGLSILRAGRKVNWYSSFTIWHSIAGLSFGVALVVIFQYGVEGLLWGSFLSMAVAFPLVWKIAVGKPSLKEGGFHSSQASEMTRYGLPLIIVNIASWVAMLSDRYVIGLFRSSAEVGIYSAAYAIPQGSIFVIASLFSLSAMPIGVRIWEAKRSEKSQEFLTNLMRYYLIIGFPATVGLSLLAKPIMHVFTTPAYFSGYSVISFIAFSAFFAGVSTIFGMVLNYYMKTKLIMYCNLICASLNIGLNFWLVPQYGFIAAAATTLLAFTADLIMKIVLSRHFLTWQFPFKSLGRVACASAVMGAAVYFIGNSLITSNLVNLIVGICAGVLIYFVMLFLLRELQPEEIKELQTLKSDFIVKFWRLIK